MKNPIRLAIAETGFFSIKAINKINPKNGMIAEAMPHQIALELSELDGFVDDVE